MTDFKKWFAARARNPDRITLEEAFNAGKQSVPSAPEGWKLVPTAESRHPGIYKMLGALHTVDKTPGSRQSKGSSSPEMMRS